MTLPAQVAEPDNLSAGRAETIDPLTQSNMFQWSFPDPARLVLDRSIA